jgi:hypothetical protein
LGESGEGFGFLDSCCHAWNPPFHNTCLFSGDECESVAEDGNMVVIQQRDATHNGPREDISRIQPSSQPHLHHSHIHFLLLEYVEPENSKEVEVMKVDAIVGHRR